MPLARAALLLASTASRSPPHIRTAAARAPAAGFTVATRISCFVLFTISILSWLSKAKRTYQEPKLPSLCDPNECSSPADSKQCESANEEISTCVRENSGVATGWPAGGTCPTKIWLVHGLDQ